MVEAFSDQLRARQQNVRRIIRQIGQCLDDRLASLRLQYVYIYRSQPSLNFIHLIYLFLILFHFCSLLIIKYYIPMHLKVERGKRSQWVESRGGPSPTPEGRKYDRDHMGYTQKVTSFSRT